MLELRKIYLDLKKRGEKLKFKTSFSSWWIRKIT
jgi:hypothetical protein